MSEQRSAAEAYKTVTSEISAAVEALRDKDEIEAAKLEHSLARLDDRMRRVGERTALTRFAVDLHWESVLEAMWSEPWMRIRSAPKPDPEADPAKLDQYDRDLGTTYESLMQLITRRRFGFRR
ncbi:hypothetical protein GCM10009836_65880 [Pseudonocardia ailaonensis]|uniref:Uncharacterized protein n=1 Tax=Pseudonocardia ailaonensis TaxID=367279 RepID=A0ABN2NMB1_9PSEU